MTQRDGAAAACASPVITKLVSAAILDENNELVHQEKIGQRHQRVPFNQDKMPGNRLEAIWLK